MNQSIIDSYQQRFPKLRFLESDNFYWSPRTKTIHYNLDALGSKAGEWALLHELGHARLKHQSYSTDMGLLQLEVEAWQAAQKLGRDLGIRINSDHIQDCLDTYRDWLYARSTCPTCELNSLQIGETTYQCLNCSTEWQVSHSRFCRPYRMQFRDKKTPPESLQTVFA